MIFSQAKTQNLLNLITSVCKIQDKWCKVELIIMDVVDCGGKLCGNWGNKWLDLPTK
jgi:hypothetical protein